MNDIEAIIIDNYSLFNSNDEIRYKDVVYEVGEYCMNACPEKFFIFVG